ncbi:MAG: hypothetical protein ACPHJ3_01030, partial [Rubripirellula sp.]
MAERYAVASGDWSDVATWDGGASLPGALDDVYSNTYSVTIDQTVSVATIRSTAGTTASAGGGFVVSTTQTITTTGGFYTDAHPLFSCTNSAGTTVTITGDLQSQGNGDGLLVASGTGDVVFNGDVLGTATNRAQITLSGTGTLTCNGDYQGGYNNYAIHATGAGTLSINGSVTGGISQVTGYGLNVSSLAVVTITGNVTGGNTNAVHITAAADVTVVGDSSANTGYAVESTSATSFITLNGTTTAYGTNPAVKSTGTVIMRGGLLNSISTGLRPVDAPYLLIDSTAELEMEFREDDAGLPGDARSLYTGGTNIGNPATTDVRSGTTFGPASEYTGSLAVPNPSYVSQGVSTDNTVGTLTAAGTLAAGTAQGGSSTTIQLAASESFADDILNGNIVKITGGTG